MRIISSYLGARRSWETSEREITIGRAAEKSASVLDLSPDHKVSRSHGRIWRENGFLWIEDLNSGRGTLLNNVEIKGQGKKKFQPGDLIVVGNTTLQVESVEPTAQTNFLEDGTTLLPDKRRAQTGVEIVQELDASNFNPLGTAGSTEPSLQHQSDAVRVKIELPPQNGSDAQLTGFPPVGSPPASPIAERRLNMICELPMLLAAKTQLALLLPTIVDRLVEMIPNAQSWALLLREGKADTLLLKAYHAVEQPSLSETLARRAISKRKAFIWRRDVEKAIGRSLLEDPCVVGMYAPMLWQDEPVGVICVTASSCEAAFSEEDLRLIVVVAQYAAMAVAGHQLQEKLRLETVVRANLLRQFSPRVADRLLAHRGRLRLGGQRSEVSVLSADIRGFTRLTQNMDPDDIVELLNDYFSVLVPVVFAHEGTIDKYVGDSILAIFGSPVSDPKHHEHSIRAALEMQAAVAKLNQARQLRGSPCCGIGIGINCGEVVHGLVGTQNRMEFTVIGEAVNLTERYCSAAAGGEILISQQVHERMWCVAETEQTTIQTKHEGEFLAYRVKRLKAGAGLDN
jgi:class 3 adenylate cyclase/pSer/pThr/pTyr-binding forkhead associated (FHA) protein